MNPDPPNTQSADFLTQPAVVACPDDLIPLVAQLVDNDARPIYMCLWRAIAHWHLQAHCEERSA